MRFASKKRYETKQPISPGEQTNNYSTRCGAKSSKAIWPETPASVYKYSSSSVAFRREILLYRSIVVGGFFHYNNYYYYYFRSFSYFSEIAISRARDSDTIATPLIRILADCFLFIRCTQYKLYIYIYYSSIIRRRAHIRRKDIIIIIINDIYRHFERESANSSKCEDGDVKPSTPPPFKPTEPQRSLYPRWFLILKVFCSFPEIPYTHVTNNYYGSPVDYHQPPSPLPVTDI